MKILYISKSTLEWDKLPLIGLVKDKVGRYNLADDAPKWLHDYLYNYRTPSRAFPYSYAKACLSQKFAKHLCEKEPHLAIKLNVAKAEIISN